MEERLHLKGLNGLRALAAISVVIAHIRLPGFRFNQFWPRSPGTYAVTIFFTLSGFLISYLLLTEKRRSQSIQVRKFYIRRILRIWPLYFAYLTVAAIVLYIQGNTVVSRELPFYLFFAANVPNIIRAGLPYLGHYWSLGVEEQFYLLWPWLIKKPTHILRMMLLFLTAFWLLKLVFRYLYLRHGYFIPLNAMGHIRFDCMAIGGIGAYFCFVKHPVFLKLAVNRTVESCCWICLFLVAVNLYRITPFLNHVVIAVVTLGLIINLSFAPRPLIGLENRFLDFLGKISYGIYVIHPLVIYGIENWLSHSSLSQNWQSGILFFSALPLTVSLAAVSYFCFERYFLQMKERFSMVRSSA